MKHLGWLALCVALIQAPAQADEQGDIAAACVKLGLGEAPCACIAEDTMKTFEPRMREVVLMSLSDVVEFDILIKAGKVTNEEVSALSDYQSHIEPICKVTE